MGTAAGGRRRRRCPSRKVRCRNIGLCSGGDDDVGAAPVSHGEPLGITRKERGRSLSSGGGALGRAAARKPAVPEGTRRRSWRKAAPATVGGECGGPREMFGTGGEAGEAAAAAHQRHMHGNPYAPDQGAAVAAIRAFSGAGDSRIWMRRSQEVDWDQRQGGESGGCGSPPIPSYTARSDPDLAAGSLAGAQAARGRPSVRRGTAAVSGGRGCYREVARGLGSYAGSQQ